MEPPAGIEPATPSLPSMVGPFGGQRGTSLRSTEPQVAGLVEDREMGCCEAVCGAAAGKSLARMQIIRGPGQGQVAAVQDSRQLSRGCWVAHDTSGVNAPLPGTKDGAGFDPTARSVAWCSASIWSAPDGSGLLTLDGVVGPDRSRPVPLDRLDDQARQTTYPQSLPRPPSCCAAQSHRRPCRRNRRSPSVGLVKGLGIEIAQRSVAR